MKKRNNTDHPWKNAFSWKQAKQEKEQRKEIELIERKHKDAKLV